MTLKSHARELAQPERRAWLQRSGGLAAAALAWPALSVSSKAFAASGTDGWGQLVVVMLRGALDGLATVSPIADPHWTELRPAPEERAAANPSPASVTAPLALDGQFVLHPKLAGVHRWYQQGELLIAHAVASPYRDRSHFEAQQMLESGGGRPYQLNTGWLGRAVQAQGGSAIALHEAMPVALRGAERASTWTPERDGVTNDPDLANRLMGMYAGDPALANTLERAMEQQNMQAGAMSGGGDRQVFVNLARQAGSFLGATGGPRVAWLELGGWDTHSQQAARLNRMLETLDQGLLALKDALGPRWGSTSVLVMSEFGRSAAFNGTQGTDHGTAGIALVAGGAIRGGRVLADWPGVARHQLHEGRDLKPTRDLRSLISPLVQRHLELPSARMASDILPGGPAPYADLWRT